MRNLPADLFNDRLAPQDARLLREALSCPVQEGPTFSWGVITAPGTELYGSPAGRDPTSAIGADTYWPQVFPTEILALGVSLLAGADYTLRIYTSQGAASVLLREIEIADGGPAFRRLDLEDDAGNGALLVPAPSGVAISVAASAIGGITVTPYLRRRTA